MSDKIMGDSGDTSIRSHNSEVQVFIDGVLDKRNELARMDLVHEEICEKTDHIIVMPEQHACKQNNCIINNEPFPINKNIKATDSKLMISTNETLKRLCRVFKILQICLAALTLFILFAIAMLYNASAIFEE